LTQFLTGRKHEQSLEALEHGFYGSSAKIVEKFSQWGDRTMAASLNTPLTLSCAMLLHLAACSNYCTSLCEFINDTSLQTQSLIFSCNNNLSLS